MLLRLSQYSVGSDEAATEEGSDLDDASSDGADPEGVTLFHLHMPSSKGFEQLMDHVWRASNGEQGPSLPAALSAGEGSDGGRDAAAAGDVSLAEQEPCLVVADWWMSHLLHKVRLGPLSITVVLNI